MLKGLSLLELIVVMAIVASLMVGGSLFLVRYQSSVQLQSAYTYAVGSIKTMQNKANNSGSITDSGGNRDNPDFFALRINSNQMLPYYCSYIGPGIPVHCESYPSSNIQGFLSLYNVRVTAVSPTGTPCHGIAFSRLAVDVSILNNGTFVANGTSTTTGSCVITLTHINSNDTRTINVDATLNKIDI